MFNRRALILLLSAAACLPQLHAADDWERISHDTAQSVENVDVDHVNVNVRDGYVYVTVNRRTTVKVFTILGQLISQQTTEPGTSRLRLNARGIYILKIGAATRRITI